MDSGDLVIRILYSLYILFFFALPIGAGVWFWSCWLKYVRTYFLLSQEHILLEFKLPKEITKSPAAMEVFFNVLFQTGSESTWYDKYWKGGMRPWFSLELVSLEGQVHFFLWTRKGLKKAIVSQLYSQYPEVEVAEAEDYSQKFTYTPGVNEIYGCYFKKNKEDYYPIKTYIDFGLDKDPKEELKIDPITPAIEFLGSIGPGEQIWIQIIIRAHRKESKKPGTWFEKVDWKYFAQEEVNKKMKRDKGDGESGDRLTKGEKNAIEAVERSISKFAFDVGIRGIYLADIEHGNGANIPGLRGAFRQYSTSDLNSIGPTQSTSFDYPWQDFKNIRLNEKKTVMIQTYQKRAFFRPAYDIGFLDRFVQSHYSIKYSVYSVEELATIYHFPGKVSSTPTMERINSKKSMAPSNLPM